MKLKTFLDNFSGEWVVSIVDSSEVGSYKDDLCATRRTQKAVFYSKEDAEEYCNFKNSKEAWDEMIKVK